MSSCVTRGHPDEEAIFRRTDHQYPPRGRSRGFGSGTLLQACYIRRYLLHLPQEVWRQEVSEVKRLKSLEEENARLKKLLVEAMLDKEALQWLLAESSDDRPEAGSRGSQSKWRL